MSVIERAASFLFMAAKYSILWTYNLFHQCSINEHLGCLFNILQQITVHITFHMCQCVYRIFSSGIAGSEGLCVGLIIKDASSSHIL